MFRRVSSIATLATLLTLVVSATPCVAEIYAPGQSVPGLSNDLFTWNVGDSASTFALWDSFADFPGGSAPGGIAPGISPAADTGFADGGTVSALTFNSFATLLSSGNAYGFNFAPGLPAFQPEFVTDAFATVRSGTSGGDFTRIVAQWQTQGSELDYSSILLSPTALTEGTLAPTLALETGRVSLGGFGGELVNHMAVWDLNTSQAEFRIDFNAQANHLSFDQFRIDSFTQATAFISPSAIPEPSSFALLGAAGCMLVMRRRRRASSGIDLRIH